jgi:hypothetical protein
LSFNRLGSSTLTNRLPAAEQIFVQIVRGHVLLLV